MDDVVDDDDDMIMGMIFLFWLWLCFGFGFVDILDVVVDESSDFMRWNVEREMLDIMDIDKVLDGLDGNCGNGMKKVFFEEDWVWGRYVEVWWLFDYVFVLSVL